jgi:hypothetical protein
MATANLTAARLRDLLHYDPETGAFTWRFSRKGRPGKAGAVAGTVDKRFGYRYIGLDGQRHGTQRLAWLYMTGEWPSAEVDHIDGDRTNDQWNNLRDVPLRMNRENIRKARSDNTSTGFLGVRINRKNGDARYQARITVKGKEMHLGRFDTPEEAHEAYLAAKRALHAGCTI